LLLSRAKNSPLLQRIQSGFLAFPASYQAGMEGEVKQPRHEANHSPLSTVRDLKFVELHLCFAIYLRSVLLSFT
jgi:hypothetical protein